MNLPTKEARRIVRAVRRAGGEVKRTQRGHLKITGPNGIAFIGTNLGDPRALRNALQDIRQHAGISI